MLAGQPYFRPTATIAQAFVPGPNKLYRIAASLPTSTALHAAYISTTLPRLMPRGVKKEHLPSKICVVCNRPFNWRKKWEKVWDQVSTCSKSCNHKRREANQKARRCALPIDDASTSYSIDVSPVDTSSMSMTRLQQALAALEATSQTDGNNMNTEQYAMSQSDDNDECDDDQSTASSTPSNQSKTGPYDDNNEQTLDPRKADKKLKKAQRRAQRQGQAEPTFGQKQCTVCGKSVDLLIRCQIDATGTWHMVCGKCWHNVSGGVVDGSPNHPHYKYGGLWKNRAKRA